jgi:hypothetical protein
VHQNTTDWILGAFFVCGQMNQQLSKVHGCMSTYYYGNNTVCAATTTLGDAAKTINTEYQIALAHRFLKKIKSLQPTTLVPQDHILQAIKAGDAIYDQSLNVEGDNMVNACLQC